MWWNRAIHWLPERKILHVHAIVSKTLTIAAQTLITATTRAKLPSRLASIAKFNSNAAAFD